MKLYKLTYPALMLLLVVSGFMLISADAPGYSSVAPAGYTGATGSYCNSCHGGNVRNASGGSVALSGLPASNFTASTTYNFSLTINHASANRTRWGFSIIAVNSAGTPVGTFSSTNSKAGINGNELSHMSAPSTPQQSSYTFNNLKWTAPASVLGDNQAVTFYFVGNAANGAGTSGDFIYSASKTIVASGVLPVRISEFTASCNMDKPTLYWKGENESEVSQYRIEKSTDGIHFSTAATLARGNSPETNNYQFTDAENHLHNGHLFYRINAEELSGASILSDVRSVTLGSGQGAFPVHIFPNPAVRGSKIFVEMDNLPTSGTVRLRLVNILGSNLADYQIGVNSSGEIIKHIQLPGNLLSGIYYLMMPEVKNSKGVPLWVQ